MCIPLVRRPVRTRSAAGVAGTLASPFERVTGIVALGPSGAASSPVRMRLNVRESPPLGHGSRARSGTGQRAPTVRVLAIDQGTSATKAVVFGDDGEILTSVEAAVTPYAVTGGGVEQDPEQLWESVCRGRTRRDRHRRPAVSTAVGFANQGETVLAWDRGTGRPLSAAISWQDRRAACASAPSWRGDAAAPDPHHRPSPRSVLRGTEDDVAAAQRHERGRRDHQRRLARSTASPALYVTDVTTASRTLLLDLETAHLVGRGRLRGLRPGPRRAPRGGRAAHRRSGAPTPSARRCRLTGLSVDQQAALVGEHCLEPGESKCTYGTGAFLLANAGPRSRRVLGGLAVSVAWQLGDAGAYCIDGQVYAAGAAVAWLQRWGFLRRAEDLDSVAGSVPRQRRRHRGPRPQRPGCAMVATRCPGQHRGDRPGRTSRPTWSGPPWRAWRPR